MDETIITVDNIIQLKHSDSFLKTMKTILMMNLVDIDKNLKSHETRMNDQSITELISI